jgi:hypothetical protein
MAKTAEELERDVEYWKTEGQRAFQERDATNKKLRDLEGRVFSDDDRRLFDKLKSQSKQIEEDAAKAAGKWDEFKGKLEAEHNERLTAESARAAKANERLSAQIVRSAFASAVDLFGGHQQSSTILDVPLAIDALGRYVKVEEDDKAPDGYRVVVTGPDGRAIEGANRSALPFDTAIMKVIESLPNKDRILRGGQKAGSGSPGAGNGASTDVDVTNLRKLDLSDPKVRAQVRAQQNRGSRVTQGKAFDVLANRSGK